MQGSPPPGYNLVATTPEDTTPAVVMVQDTEPILSDLEKALKSTKEVSETKEKNVWKAMEKNETDTERTGTG